MATTNRALGDQTQGPFLLLGLEQTTHRPGREPDAQDNVAYANDHGQDWNGPDWKFKSSTLKKDRDSDYCRNHVEPNCF
jgi:hypothetical protein